MTRRSGSGPRSDRKADVAKFMNQIIGNRLKRAGDGRNIMTDIGRERMAVGDGPWVSVSQAYEQYCEGQAKSSWQKKRIAVANLLNELWGRPAEAKPGDGKFLPKQFRYGPSYQRPGLED